MKKNITVNLFGQLYAIDEDAYSLLEQYLQNMKRYFATREGGDEIADDIEHRVAELFAELQASGVQAIAIEHVQEIICRIGNPEQLDGEESAEESSAAFAPNEGSSEDEPSQTTTNNDCSTSWYKKYSTQFRSFFHGRHLYRDADNVMVGGVMSGLCKYFGGSDPLPWRILMVLACLLSYATLALVYLVAWALIPQARTADQRLQMQGKPVNPQTLNEELMKQTAARPAPVASSSVRSNARGCLSALLVFVLFCTKLFLSLVVGGFFLYLTIVFIGLLLFSFGGTHLFGDEYAEIPLMELFADNPDILSMATVAAGAGVLCLVLLLYFLIRMMIVRPATAETSKPSRLSVVRRWSFWLTIILSGALAVTLLVVVLLRTYAIKEHEYRVSNHVGGYFLYSQERRQLTDSGWEVKKYENTNANGFLFDSNPNLFAYDGVSEYMTFQQADLSKPMRVVIERREPFEPGYYHFEAIGYAKSQGGYLYVRTPQDTLVQGIPVDDVNNWGNMARMGLDQLRQTSYFAEVADSLNYTEWLYERIKPFSYIRSASFYHPGGDLSMGVTNVPEYIGLPVTQGATRKFGLLRMNVVRDSVNTSSVSSSTSHRSF